MNKIFGALCPKHPRLNGERYALENRCVGCKKDRNSKHRAGRLDELRDSSRRRNREKYHADPEYKSKMIYSARLRKSRMSEAQPKWVDHKELQKVYAKARDSGLTVDHIIPLKHPLVCGLHVPWNLQLMSREENSSKHNRIEVNK